LPTNDYFGLSKFNINGTSISLGPSAAPYLSKFVNQFSIVNGVVMGKSDVGHESAMRYFTTADSSGTGSSMAAALAAKKYGNIHLASNTKVQLRGDLLNQVSIEGIRLMKTDEANSSGVNFRGRHLKNNSDSKFREELISMNSDDELKKRQSFYKKFEQITLDTNQIVDTEIFGANNEIVRKLAAGFASDMFQAAELEISASLDSHSDYDGSHVEEQKKVWNFVSSLFEIFSRIECGESNECLFPNNLTIVVFSEFSREPFLNTSKGKDHNFFDNSALIAGKGIRSGQMIGHNILKVLPQGGPSQLHGAAWNFAEGRPAFSLEDRVNLIRPEHIWQTLGASMGITDVLGNKVDVLDSLLNS
jgi:uncharacterized protein (DUF1501 family)